jgi:SET and MYND domain-containing protein
MTEYNELCYKDDDDDDEDYDDITQKKSGQEDDHLRIIAQCHQLLLIMGETSAAKVAHDLLDPNPRLASRFISRLTMNGFTICNSEQEVLGVGVYPRASMINHSCRPNAVQSFWLSSTERLPPMLQITMCRNAKVGEEVTISYCDVSVPRYDRRKELKRNYNFCCECMLCQDLERDDALIGLRCSSHKCKGRVKTSAGSHEMAYIKRQYFCDECGRSNFDEALEQDLSRLQARITAIENKLKDGSVHKEAGKELLAHFDSVLFLCYRQTSWYLAKLCDMYMNWCSNALRYCSNEKEQLDMCNDALSLVFEAREATEFSYDYEGSLTCLMKRGTEAKLRLFVNPTDFEALAILRDVRRDLMCYYPSSDEVLVSLDESIRSYSFS